MGKEYITIGDGYFYNRPSSPSVPPKKYEETAYGKGEHVLGNLVYIRYKNSFTPMIKLDKGVTTEFRYIKADSVQPKTSSSFTNADTVYDLQSNMIDSDLSCHRGDLRASSFNGGAMDVFTGGDSAVDGSTSSKVEYSESEVNALYKKSGSKQPLKEWVKSDSAKSTLSNIGKFGLGVLGALSGGAQQQSSSQTSMDNSNSNTVDDGEKKILGMHPLTFGVVVLGVVGAAIIGYKLLTKKGVVVPPVK
jgi:hypothetical protein